jgi:hypothetical protein
VQLHTLGVEDCGALTSFPGSLDCLSALTRIDSSPCTYKLCSTEGGLYTERQWHAELARDTKMLAERVQERELRGLYTERQWHAELARRTKMLAKRVQERELRAQHEERATLLQERADLKEGPELEERAKLQERAVGMISPPRGCICFMCRGLLFSNWLEPSRASWSGAGWYRMEQALQGSSQLGAAMHPLHYL